MSRKCRKEAENWAAWEIPEEQLAALCVDEKELAEKLGDYVVPSLEVEVPALDVEVPVFDIEVPSFDFDTASLDFEPINYDWGQQCQN